MTDRFSRALFYRGEIVRLHARGFGELRSGRASVFFAASGVDDPQHRFDDLRVGMKVRFRLQDRHGRREARSVTVLNDKSARRSDERAA
jgi:hypothetical protein